MNNNKPKPQVILSDPFHFFDENGRKIKVTAAGSLGILASGYKGVMVWKQEVQKEIDKQNYAKANE